MRLYLDTEFDGHGGKLISMGIAAEDGREWYQVLQVPKHPHPWVKEHVIPFLSIETYRGLPVGEDFFAEDLHKFLGRYNHAEVIADWPADFEHFCANLTFAGGLAGFKTPWIGTMRLISGADPRSVVPHNALSDARALRDWHLETVK